MIERSIFPANGSSVELNNCLEEARIATAHRNADVNALIARLVGDGLFVVVCSTTAYCKSTDAICGEHRSCLGAYGSRHAADARVADAYVAAGPCSDDSFFVLPALPPPPRAIVEDDGCPF